MIYSYVDTSYIEQYLSDLQRDDQIPFAVAKSLNDLAKRIQDEIRKGIEERFTLRKRAWILNRIYIDKSTKATKTNYTVVIEVNEPYDILSKFEKGGDKIAYNGHKFVCVPNRKVFTNGKIPDELRIKNLHLQKIKGNTQGDQRTFLIDSKKTGVPLILQDVAGIKGRKGKGRSKTTNNRILYTLVRKVKVPAKLNFVSTAKAVIDAEAKSIFDKNIQYVLDTAKRK